MAKAPKNAQTVEALAIAIIAVATVTVPSVMVIRSVQLAMARLFARTAMVQLLARPVAAMVTALIARTATANVRRAQGRARSHFHR